MADKKKYVTSSDVLQNASRSKNEENVTKNSSYVSSEDVLRNASRSMVYKYLKSDAELANTVVKQSNERFSNRTGADSYVSDYKDYYSTIKNKYSQFDEHRKYVFDYIEKYGDSLDEDEKNELINAYKELSSGMGTAYDYAKQDKDYWSQWDSEEAYKKDYNPKEKQS